MPAVRKWLVRRSPASAPCCVIINYSDDTAKYIHPNGEVGWRASASDGERVIAQWTANELLENNFNAWHLVEEVTL